MTRKLRAAVVAGALAATMVPAAPAYASHSCSLENDDDNTLDRLCESHPDTLLEFLYCLVSKSC